MDGVFRIFFVYVACSVRPMHELLGRVRPSHADLYIQEFIDMTALVTGADAGIYLAKRAGRNHIEAVLVSDVGI